jgi:hypothetical protein
MELVKQDCLIIVVNRSKGHTDRPTSATFEYTIVLSTLLTTIQRDLIEQEEPTLNPGILVSKQCPLRASAHLLR